MADANVCIGCGESDETARLERCQICLRYFCPDCSVRSSGRRFCSAECGRIYFYGESDEDEDADIGS